MRVHLRDEGDVMTVAHLVPRKPNAKVIEALEQQLERAKAGQTQHIVIIGSGSGETSFAMFGDPPTLLYSLEIAKREILSDD